MHDCYAYWLENILKMCNLPFDFHIYKVSGGVCLCIKGKGVPHNGTSGFRTERWDKWTILGKTAARI